MQKECLACIVHGNYIACDTHLEGLFGYAQDCLIMLRECET